MLWNETVPYWTVNLKEKLKIGVKEYKTFPEDEHETDSKSAAPKKNTFNKSLYRK